MKPKKSFGQHFLKNEEITRSIAESLNLNLGTKDVLEIGPGKGALTKYLLELPINLKVVEADWDMVGYLKENFPLLDNRIVSSNILKVKLNELFDNQFLVVGNFPYNISSQILFKVLEYRSRIPEMVGMFQKEVGFRVAAPPGSKVFGVTSVLVQAFFHADVLFEVDKSNFDPPPKVQSVVIRLRRKENADLGCDYSLFKSIVKITFGQRRKMLRNTLKQFVSDPGFLKEERFQKRPEQLSVQEFVDLTNEISNLRSKN